MLTDLLGYLAAVLTTFAYLPQAIKAFRTKSTKNMSLSMWTLMFAGISCWLVYGIRLGAGPLIVANGISFVLVGATLLLKIRNG